MSDTFEVTVYEGYIIDVPDEDAEAFSRNPLDTNPLVGLKGEGYGWSYPHCNAEQLHPHAFLTCCVRTSCLARVDPDGPGICPACITDLRSTP